MKLLLVHNYYQQRGGEDVVFEAEAALLERHGHRVMRYTARNADVGARSALRLGAGAIWNGTTYREVRELLRRERPAVMHVHNTHSIISPAVYHAARAVGTPVVQTLHNYRLVCPSAILFRDGHVCETCLHRALAVPGIRHACYRGSHWASGAVAAVSAAHRVTGTWRRGVDVYIALTTFARDKFIEAGLPSRKLVVKPNFVPDPGIVVKRGEYALFVGRLSPEKGLHTLMEAWRRLGNRIPLIVIGDGPAAEQVKAAARAGIGVEWWGHRSHDDVAKAMANARFLVFPSLWYETFGLTIIEAYAVGLPVLASNLGAMATLVTHGRTGLHFRPGDADDLAAQVTWAIAHPEELRELGRNARLEYEALYTPERNHDLLLDVYRRVTRDGVGQASSDIRRSGAEVVR
jgi:glycosyltransferase involved in cell wall biosynthesis